MNSLSVLFALPVIGLGGYYAYKSLYKYMVSRALDEVMQRLAASPETFQVLHRGAMISYQYGGKNYQVCVPYDATKVRNALRKEVFLIVDNPDGQQKRINITQKPGIPYLYSPQFLGGNKIIVTKDEQIIAEFKEEEIPTFNI